MANVLTAIVNIINNADNHIQRQIQPGNNRANDAGDMLEAFIQDSFANSYGKEGRELNRLLGETFSYLGNNTNPPDMILKGSDAIEVKKIQSFSTSELQLNSSYPKDKIYSDSTLISKYAKECEEGGWTEKNMLYVVGIVPKDTIKRLWFVYGDCFCADRSVYENVKKRIVEGINNIAGIELVETKELGNVRKIDPLSYTILRIRGMWLLKSPNKAFEKYVEYDNNKDLQIFALIKKDKYDQFPDGDRTELERLASIEDLELPNPNNKASFIQCKLISYTKE